VLIRESSGHAVRPFAARTTEKYSSCHAGKRERRSARERRRWCGVGVALVWRWRGVGVALAWRWRGVGVALAWRWRGGGWVAARGSGESGALARGTCRRAGSRKEIVGIDGRAGGAAPGVY
jgi:hypothetical protein